MNIKHEKINDFSVIRIDGRIDTLNSTALEVEMDQLRSRGEIKIIIDCNDLKYISSSGLRVFLNAQKKAISTKGKLSLCNMQLPIREIFDISGFSSIFTIYNSLDEAMDH
jgi:serine/threonine-protein kinase RsbW